MPTELVGTILLAHGSAAPQQREVISALAERAGNLDGSVWQPAFLDHHGPTVREAAINLVHAGAKRIVVVPALLSRAFHASHDVPVAIADAGITVPVAVADPLGPDAGLFTIIYAHLMDDPPRVDLAGATTEWTIVVASAGASDERSRAQFIEAVNDWAPGLSGVEAVPAFIAGGDPDVVEATRRLRAEGRSVVLAPFLLADGALYQRARAQATANGTVEVLPPLGAADAVVAILVARRDACATV